MQHSNGYILGFAAMVIIVCAGILSLLANGLKDKQVEQEEFFIKKNILTVFDINYPAEGSPAEILDIYNENIDVFFIDYKGNKIEVDETTKNDYDALVEYKRFSFAYNEVNDLSNIEATAEYKKSALKLAVFFKKSSDNKPTAYAIPVFGKGLWSTLKGYLAFDNDFNTVKGITFYEHKETPGLGARIEEQWFLDNFKGKQIFGENGELSSVTVKKGPINPSNPQEKMHMVDGISGATITCNGVSQLLMKDLSLYETFFKKMIQESEMGETEKDLSLSVQ